MYKSGEGGGWSRLYLYLHFHWLSSTTHAIPPSERQVTDPGPSQEQNFNVIHLPLVPAPSTASFLGRASRKANTSGKRSPRHILETLRGGMERQVPGGHGGSGLVPGGLGRARGAWSLQPRLCVGLLAAGLCSGRRFPGCERSSPPGWCGK